MIKKILYAVLIVWMIFSVFNSDIVLAGDPQGTTQTGKDGGTGNGKSGGTSKGSSGDSIISGANDFISTGEQEVKNGNTIEQGELVNTSNDIYNIVLAIAMVVAVAVGIVLGIKFMTSGVDEQAKIKEMLVPYVAGCIVVFGSIGIWKLAVNVFSKF